MRRRDFIKVIAGAAVAWPLPLVAQQAMPVIGFLNSTSPQEWAPWVAVFRQGLNEAGYVEGRNVAIEYRWAQGQYDLLPELAADLVRRRVAVIVTSGGDITTWAAKAVTQSIPIVFIVGNDPAKSGLVASLNRPEGNATGVTNFTALLNVKRLQILHEAVPHAQVIAALLNPSSTRAESDTAEIQNAARELGVKLHILHAAAESDIDTVFAKLAEHGAEALLIMGDPMFTARRDRLVALAARHSIPTMHPNLAFARSGGLMGYGQKNSFDQYRVLGTYAGRILAGAKPADLPVQQPVNIELVINLKTAKTLGFTFPLSLLGRADEVIE